MIKYINIPIKLLQFDMNLSVKILFSALVVLTKKGTTYTTASNLYLGEMMRKNSSQISAMLGELKKRNFITITRGLGRRQIALNTKPLIEKELLVKLREVKNVK